MKKEKKAIILNSLIIVFEIFALIITYKANGRVAIEYYTQLSNLLALSSSTAYLLYKNKRVVSYLKYISTLGMTLTFIVVVIILLPMYNFNFNMMFFRESMSIQHVICPILSFITFVFYDKLIKFNKKDSFLVVLFTIVYGFIFMALNYFNLFVGPYPFLQVRNQSVIESIIWFITIIGIAYLISLTLRKIRIKYNK